jgi:ribosomal protein S18 acetylase RimI-like enzyme
VEKVIVREASLADLNLCLSLDHDCTTDHVWQMTAQRSEFGLNVAFRVVRLPRPMKARYPRSLDQLVENWQRKEGFFVAEVDGQVRGYVDALARRWEEIAWVANLAVDRNYRRHRIGTALIQQAQQWARSQKLTGLVVEATTKNYPALRMYQRLGFEFCGYNDRYYTNQDIAIFFAQRLR